MLNILYEESKIFATKERAPYSIVLELFYDASQHQKVPVPPLSGTTKKLHREGDNQVGTVHELELVTPRHNHDEGTTEALK